MKKFKFLFLLLVVFMLGACSNPDLLEGDSEDKLSVEVIEGEESLEDEITELEYFVESDAPVELGLKAPNFSLENLDIDGSPIKLSDYEGSYVLINFWASWCVYCEEEMPDLEDFNNENEDLKVIAVNVQESRELAEKFISEGGYSFDVALDSDGDLTKAYYVSSFPTSVFIDRQGRLIGGVQGLMSKEDMYQVFEFVKEEEERLESEEQ